MKYSAVVLDLDGTLLNSDKQVSDRNHKSIMACYEQGIKIIFATARPPRATKWFLPQKLLDIGSFVYYNGALISCNHSGINLHEPIYSDISAEILNHCIHNNPEIELSIEVQDEWFSLKEIDYSVTMNARGNPIVKSLEELVSFDATKILITGSLDLEMLKEKFSSLVNIIVTDQGQLIQIMSKNVSKELAVSKLLDAYSIQFKRVITFGDDHNDVGLFNTCGRSVAMDNAVKELKDIASEVRTVMMQTGLPLY
jgi:Cof subfamily protein (haloacid dehalogenase superfamily)